MDGPGTIWLAGAAAAALASLAAGFAIALLLRRMNGAGNRVATRARLVEAERESAVLEAFERLAASSNRKVWADRVVSALVDLTGSTGAAVVLRAPGSDSMSLAGSSVPLVIRNLDATLREPHGPSRRALSSGEPVLMSVGELPSWAAAAGYEAGAAIPVLFHGASIGIAYALGKPWQVPTPEALRAAARFVALAAVHYAVAAPFTTPAAPTAPAAPAARAAAPVPAALANVGPGVADRRHAVARAVGPASPAASVPVSAVKHATPPPPAAGATAATAASPLPGSSSAPAAVPAAVARSAEPERRRIDLPGVVVDPRNERCVIDGRAVALSKTEFDLLHALASNGGDVVSSEELVKAVWGDSSTAPGSSLDVTIHRIRKKLSRAPGGAELIRTVRGKGYAILVPDPSAPVAEKSPSRPAAD
jgi:DNA-binding winged helix-turn-helix (wHTH) protein